MMVPSRAWRAAVSAARSHRPEQHSVEIDVLDCPMVAQELVILRHVEREPVGVDQAVLKLRHVGIEDVVEHDLPIDDARAGDGADTADLCADALVHEQAGQAREAVEGRLAVVAEHLGQGLLGVLEHPTESYAALGLRPIEPSHDQVEHVAILVGGLIAQQRAEVEKDFLSHLLGGFTAEIRELGDGLGDIARPGRPAMTLDEGAVGLGQQSIGRQFADQLAVLGRAEHFGVDREIAAERRCASGLGGGPCVPVQHDATSIGGQGAFDMAEYLGGRAHAMDGQDFPALLGARAQDALEHAFLRGEARIEAWTSVEPDLADIAGIGQVALEDRELRFALGDELRMQAEGDSDVLRRGREFAVALPRSRSRRHRESRHALAITLAN